MRTALWMAVVIALAQAQTAEPRLKTRPSLPEPVPMAGPDGRVDPRFAAAGARLTDTADQFSRTAQQYMCQETLQQRAIRPRSLRKKKGKAAAQAATPQYDQRQIVSFYAFTTVGRSPVIREIRQVLTVDKEIVAKENEGRTTFRNALLTHDDEVKNNLLTRFDVEGLKGVATDLGQMVLLFARNSINNFTFEYDREDTVGGARTLVLRYTQRHGTEGVRITEGRKQMRQDLRGWLWLKLPDYDPMRITMISAHTEKNHEIRDEAEVNYAHNSSGALLPSAVIHRRWEDNILAADDDFRYSDWQPLK